METARVFTNGRSQAIRIPKEYRFEVDEVFINKIGDMVVLSSKEEIAEAFDRGARMLTDDFLDNGVPDPVSSERDNL